MARLLEVLFLLLFLISFSECYAMEDMNFAMVSTMTVCFKNSVIGFSMSPVLLHTCLLDSIHSLLHDYILLDLVQTMLLWLHNYIHSDKT